MADHFLSVGDQVVYRPGFGYQAETMVTVIALEETAYGEKYGTEVDGISKETFDAKAFVASFDNGHWGYGHQVDRKVGA